MEGYEGARIDGGATVFTEMLESQRRRFYFTLPSKAPGYSRWDMTVFRYAGDYLEMIDTLTENKKQVDEGVRARINMPSISQSEWMLIGNISTQERCLSHSVTN